MRLNRVIGLSAALAILFAAGCGAATKSVKVVDESQLGYGDRGTPPPVEYSKAAPGTAKRFERSYENAPPLIPHSVDGLLPITKNNNACLGCHMPSVAGSMGATPISPTHFKDFFAANKKKIQHFKGASKIHHDKNDIAPQRYNCIQCHVPQANVKPLVANKFTPEFRNPENRHKSTLLEKLNEGVQ